MKRILLAAALGLTLLPLGGCFPVAATGIVVGGLMADDRRTSGTYVEDEGIELKGANRIRDEYNPDRVHVSVTSFNRRVLLTGEVPDEATRAKVEEIVKGVPSVREIQNETAIGGTSSFASRTGDSFITAKVKTHFLDEKRFKANQVKVVTEAGTVYLLGLVKQDEGAAAGEVTARIGGVKKVVKYFEYMD